MKTIERAPTSHRTDLIDQVREKLETLSQSERSIAILLLDDPAAFSQLGVRQIAQRLEISEPTVVRFCRNVGCDGFKDLKFQLVQDVAIRQALQDSTPQTVAPEASLPQTSASYDLIEKCCNDAIVTLEQVKRALDFSEVTASAELIKSARRVFIYGLGGSSAMMAQELNNRLFRLGVTCTVYLDSYQQRMSAATVTKEDVAVLISSTGRPRALQDVAELSKYFGCKCIGIVPQSSALGREVDHCMNVDLTQSGVDLFQPNPMRFAQLMTIDILAVEVANLLGDAATETLKRTRASIASLHGIAPQQPIGD